MIFLCIYDIKISGLDVCAVYDSYFGTTGYLKPGESHLPARKLNLIGKPGSVNMIG